MIYTYNLRIYIFILIYIIYNYMYIYIYDYIYNYIHIIIYVRYIAVWKQLWHETLCGAGATSAQLGTV